MRMSAGVGGRGHAASCVFGELLDDTSWDWWKVMREVFIGPFVSAA